ncbi:MAG TPA: PAS domain S-box protein, partial [Terriglobales bacterium]
MSPIDLRDGAEGSASRLRNLAATLLSPSLLEAIPDAIVAVSQQGIILQANSQTESMFGYAREELIGQPIEILVPESFREQHRHHRDQFVEQPKARRMGPGLDLRGRRRDGSEFPVEISLSPLETDDGIVVLSAIRDVSERKRIEAELQRVHHELSERMDRQLW